MSETKLEFAKDYQPPHGLPFPSTGSYESDRQKFIERRDLLYGENTKILKNSWEENAPSQEILKSRRALTALDKFFDLVEEC